MCVEKNEVDVLHLMDISIHICKVLYTCASICKPPDPLSSPPKGLERRRAQAIPLQAQTCDPKEKLWAAFRLKRRVLQSFPGCSCQGKNEGRNSSLKRP